MFMLFAPLIKSVYSSNSIERDDTVEIQRKAYETLCRHSLNALVRIWDVLQNKDAAQDDPYLSYTYLSCVSHHIPLYYY